MKTGICVRTDGAPLRLIEKQLRHFCDGNQRIEEITGPLIESIDDSILRLKEYGCKRLVVLHEEWELDRFEVALKKEYGHLFEEIEVIPEGWYRVPLREQTPPVAPTVTTAPTTPTAKTTNQNPQVKTQVPTAYIFPMNPLSGANGWGTITIPPGAKVINYITQNMMKSFAFNIDAAQLFSNHFLQSDQYKEQLLSAIVVNQGTVQSELQKLGVGKLVDSNGNDLQGVTFDNYVYKNPPPDPNAPALFKALVEISNSINKGQIQVNPKAVQEYLTKVENSGKLGYINALLISAQASLKHNPKQNGDPSKIVKQFMDTFGITADLQNLAKEANESGLGLVNAAVSFAGKQLQKVKKDGEKKKPHHIELLVSHKSFPTVWNGLPKDTKIYRVDSNIKTFIDNMIKNQKGLNKEGEDKAKTEGQEQSREDKDINSNEKAISTNTKQESLVDSFLRLREANPMETISNHGELMMSVLKNLEKPDNAVGVVALDGKSLVKFLATIDDNGKITEQYDKPQPVKFQGTIESQIPVQKGKGINYKWITKEEFQKLKSFLGTGAKSSLGKIKIGDPQAQKPSAIKQETGEILDSITSGATGGQTGFKM